MDKKSMTALILGAALTGAVSPEMAAEITNKTPNQAAKTDSKKCEQMKCGAGKCGSMKADPNCETGKDKNTEKNYDSKNFKKSGK